MSDDSRVIVRNVMADHWGLVMGYGVCTLLLGVVLAAWPSETLTVVAILIAIQLIISGSVQLFLAIAPSGAAALGRVIIGLVGTFAITVGILIVVDPLQTLTIVGILVGLWLVMAGLADIALAFLDSGESSRLWDVVRGVLCIIVGGFLIVNPERSLGLLVLLACIWLIGYGVVTIVAALRLRSLRGEPTSGSGRHRHDSRGGTDPVTHP
jgi:uncharacterized membrane protein HdeD (DUF308 family)